MHDNLDALLQNAAEEFMTNVAPRPADQVRSRGDRRRRLTMLRALAVAAIVISGGSALAAHARAADHRQGSQAATPGHKASPDGAAAGEIQVAEAVSCRTASDCWLVGSQTAQFGSAGTGLTEHWNGSRWSVVPSPASVGTLIGVACPGAKDCWAVTGNLGFEHWNGKRWSLRPVSVPAGASSARPSGAISCPSASLCWAAGNMSVGNAIVPWVERWNGKSWSVEQVPSRSSVSVLNSVSCSDARHCLATGFWQSPHALKGGVMAERWDGSFWKVVADPAAGKNEIDGLSCGAATSCVGVGAGGRGSVTITYAQVWNGSAWVPSHAVGPGRSSLNQVSCVSASWCMPSRARPAACGGRTPGGQDSRVDSESFLAAAGELLAIPSTADQPDELAKALDFTIEFAAASSGAAGGFTVERFESGGKPSALLYLGGEGQQRPSFRIILNAHLDVIPAQARQFSPRLDDGRLYARGAQDMKVSALVLARVFGELAGSLPYPIGLQLVTDEEIGGRDGTLHQLERGVTGSFVIVGEHSRLRIVADSKGMVAANLRAVGKAAHSAYPWLGDNALVKLQASVARILERYPVATQEAWRTTVNLARIETSNQARNKIPDLAEAWLDIRYPPQDPDFDQRSVAEVLRYLASFCEPGVTPLVDHVDPPHHANRGSLEIRELQRAVTSQGYDASFLRKHGAADGRFYYQRGIDAVIFGVGGDGQHGPDEYVDISTIEPYYRALREFLRAIGAAQDG